MILSLNSTRYSSLSPPAPHILGIFLQRASHFHNYPLFITHSPSCISHTRAPLLHLGPCFDLLQGRFSPDFLTMEARKPKYSLFPAPPLSKPLSSTLDLPPAPQESLTLNPEDPTTRQERSPPPPAEPLPSKTHDPPNSPEPSHPNHQVAPRSQEQPPPEPDSPISPSEMTTSSFSTTSVSSLKPAPLSLPAPPQQPRNHHRRAFVRHGLGGAGNYHKRPDSSPNSDYSGFLSSLLGTFSNRKRKTRQYPESDSTGCSQYSNQALPLGAAEVLKRKMLGQASAGKSSTSRDRN